MKIIDKLQDKGSTGKTWAASAGGVESRYKVRICPECANRGFPNQEIILKYLETFEIQQPNSALHRKRVLLEKKYEAFDANDPTRKHEHKVNVREDVSA